MKKCECHRSKGKFIDWPHADWCPTNDPVCETCGGEGRIMQMVCYGGSPTEEMGPCPDCDDTLYGEKPSPFKGLVCDVDIGKNDISAPIWSYEGKPIKILEDRIEEEKQKYLKLMNHNMFHVYVWNLQKRIWNL